MFIHLLALHADVLFSVTYQNFPSSGPYVLRTTPTIHT